VALDTVAAAIEALVRPGKGAGRNLRMSRPGKTEHERDETYPGQNPEVATHALYLCAPHNMS